MGRLQKTVIIKKSSLPVFILDRKKEPKLKFFLDPKTRYNFLIALGVQNQDGSVRATRRKKFAQINEFLKVISETIDQKTLPRLVTIYDYGCGNAYITFAIHYYFSEILKKEVTTVGVDHNKTIIQKRNDIVKSLNIKNLSFIESEISKFKMPSNPTIVLSLHACDTATDDALAKGINANSKYIFAVPCCHKNIQQNLPSKKFPTQLHQIASHGILLQRTCDIVTDTFRALVLRIKGYKTDVFEFVDSSHSAKNLMIRGVLLPHRTDTKSFLREYETLKKFWNVSPYIESLLKLR